jgi:hypothetical protein
MDWTFRLSGQLHRLLAALALTLALLNLRFVVEAPRPELTGLGWRALAAQFLLSYVAVFWVRLAYEALRHQWQAWRTTAELPSTTRSSAPAAIYQDRTTE